jgi:hypothetical protein
MTKRCRPHRRRRAIGAGNTASVCAALTATETTTLQRGEVGGGSAGRPALPCERGGDGVACV